MNKMKKKFLLSTLFAVLFFLTGCTDGTTLPGGTTTLPNDGSTSTNQPSSGLNQQDNGVGTSVIPPQETGIGTEFDLADFMYAYPALHDKTAEKEFLVTTQNSNSFFDPGKSYVKRIQEGLTDTLGDKIVNVFENNTLTEHAVINDTRITVTFYQDNTETGTEQYRRMVRLHEDMYRTQEGACVYKEIFDNGLDISEIVPRQANPNESIAHFGKVLHVYCGTRTGTIIDRYYADGWGVIAEISQNSDGTTTYSVLNQSSYAIN